jgi:predicted protein tyrosine phosphatase
MKIVEVFALTRLECEQRLARGETGSAWRGLVSIGDPGAAPPAGLDRLNCPVLRLEFLDRYDSGHGGEKAGPSSVHLIALADFAAKVRERQGIALVHCDAGLSRGPTVAWVLSALLAGPGHEDRSLETILAYRQGAGLNPWLVTLAQRMFREFDFAEPMARKYQCHPRK